MNMDAKAKALFAQFDADLEALREKNRTLLRQCANAMLANAERPPALVATEDAPRLDLRRAERLAKRQQISPKRARHEYAETYYEASGFLSPAKRIS